MIRFEGSTEALLVCFPYTQGVAVFPLPWVNSSNFFSKLSISPLKTHIRCIHHMPELFDRRLITSSFRLNFLPFQLQPGPIRQLIGEGRHEEYFCYRSPEGFVKPNLWMSAQHKNARMTRTHMRRNWFLAR
jgi:hypothetical protein